MSNNDIGTILKQYAPAITFNFKDLEGFDNSKQEFILKNRKWEGDFNTLFYNIYNSTSDGRYFFSIVVHGKIVMTGLNRIDCVGAARLPLDELSVPRIAATIDNKLKITSDSANGPAGMLDQDKENRIFYRKEIDDYFNAQPLLR